MVWDDDAIAFEAEWENIFCELEAVAEEAAESSTVDDAAEEGDAPLLQTAPPVSLTPALFSHQHLASSPDLHRVHSLLTILR